MLRSIEEIKKIMEGCLSRTRMVAETDKNRTRRNARLDSLQLMKIDMTATLNHLAQLDDPTTDPFAGERFRLVNRESGAGDQTPPPAAPDAQPGSDEFSDDEFRNAARQGL